MTRVCVVTIYVSNMDEAIDFYCNKMGFRLQSREFYPEIVELQHEGLPIILSKAERPAQASYPSHAQVVLGIETPDLQATIRDLEAKGVELLHHSPQPFPGGVFVAVRDPSGNTLEVLEFQR